MNGLWWFLWWLMVVPMVTTVPVVVQEVVPMVVDGGLYLWRILGMHSMKEYHSINNCANRNSKYNTTNNMKITATATLATVARTQAGSEYLHRECGDVSANWTSQTSVHFACLWKTTANASAFQKGYQQDRNMSRAWGKGTVIRLPYFELRSFAEVVPK